MKLQALSVGVLGAVCVSLVKVIHGYWVSFQWPVELWLLLVGAISVALSYWFFHKRGWDFTYTGVTDLSIQTQTPAVSDSWSLWGSRSLTSFLLSLFGGKAGAEGLIIELSQMVQTRFYSFESLWFEKWRRNTLGCAIAAAVAASFGAPFAAVILVIELGIGGELIYASVSALVALVGSKLLASGWALESFNISGMNSHFNLIDPLEWGKVLAAAGLGASVGGLLILFTTWARESIRQVARGRVWLMGLIGFVLLFLVQGVSHAPDLSSSELLEGVLWSRFSLSQVTLLVIAQFMSASLLMAAIGSAGWFWPLLSLGGMVGYILSVGGGYSQVEFSMVPAFVSASVLWAVVLGAPISGALLVFELTQSREILFPSLLFALLAVEVFRYFKWDSLVVKDLKARGMGLLFGRSEEVLKSLQVDQVMVTDLTIIEEFQTLDEIQAQVGQSQYPFLFVVSVDRKYRGVLTVDQVFQKFSGPHSGKFLQAIDLLYHSDLEVPTVLLGSRLFDLGRSEQRNPCLVVVSQDGRLEGVLFDYLIRFAYDREVARRSFRFMSKERG